jgi:hypothetical protein
VYKYARQQNNNPHLLNKVLSAVGSPGKCWVSSHCHAPEQFLAQVEPILDSLKNTLTVYLNTVIKKAYINEKGDKIVGVRVIRRIPNMEKTKCGGYDRFLSQDIPDWYSEKDSERFKKEVIDIKNENGIYLDSSNWGELLVLSGAKYIQGVDHAGQNNDTCGQSFTYPFAQEYYSKDTNEPKESPYPIPPGAKEYYGLGTHTWNSVFTYRRVLGKTPFNANITVGDITLQNWGNGNDNVFKYLFLNYEDTKKQLNDWMGGVDLKALEIGEHLAMGWHYEYKKLAKDETLAKRIGLNVNILGTCHGLSKMPYIRDTRRSIGVDGFTINELDLSGNIAQLTGTQFPDRVALGCYDIDVHSIYGCKYPGYIHHKILPYFIPFRALTNQKIMNLIVTGKTMAQTFFANSAIRLHPSEWSSGHAGGSAAAFMVQQKILDTKLIANDEQKILQLQHLVKRFQPICWTIEGQTYPKNAFC